MQMKAEFSETKGKARKLIASHLCGYTAPVKAKIKI